MGCDENSSNIQEAHSDYEEKNSSATHPVIDRAQHAHNRIQLDEWGSFVCTMGNEGEQLRCLADSGAICSLIALKTVDGSDHLSRIIREPIETKKFYAGNDGVLISNHMIRVVFVTDEGIILSVPLYITN